MNGSVCNRCLFVDLPVVEVNTTQFFSARLEVLFGRKALDSEHVSKPGHVVRSWGFLVVCFLFFCLAPLPFSPLPPVPCGRFARLSVMYCSFLPFGTRNFRK